MTKLVLHHDEGMALESRRYTAIHVVIVLFVTLILFVAARGDLWFDEVWSLFIAHQAGSLPALFKGGAQCDNNHIVNSAYLLLWNGKQPYVVYRLLSVLCGVGTIWGLQRHVFRVFGGPASIATGVLAGCSYMFVLYFSEARGYAAALFFTSCAYSILNRSQVKPHLASALLFGVCVMLGVLSHASVLVIIPALGLLALTMLHEQGKNLLRSSGILALYFLPAALVLAVYYRFFIMTMAIGGGSVVDGMWAKAVRYAIGRMTGIPVDSAVGAAVAMAITAIIYVYGLLLLYRTNRSLFVFYISVPVSMAGLLFVQSTSSFIYPRYFLIGFPFFYMLAGMVWQQFYYRLPKLRWLGCVILLVYVYGQFVYMKRKRPNNHPLEKNQDAWRCRFFSHFDGVSSLIC